MTLTDILLVANVIVVGVVAVWQRHRLTALEARMASRTHLALAMKVFKLRGDKLSERQIAVDHALAALPKVLEARFKEYARSDRVAKIENSLDERITHIVTQVALTPFDKDQKICTRCNRLVARWAFVPPHSQTVICANCSPASEHK